MFGLVLEDALERADNLSARQSAVINSRRGRRIEYVHRHHQCQTAALWEAAGRALFTMFTGDTMAVERVLSGVPIWMLPRKLKSGGGERFPAAEARRCELTTQPR